MSGLAILCSGQGRQDWASFETLLKYPEAKFLFDELCKSQSMPEELKKYFRAPEKYPALIFKNEFAQPFIVMYQMLLWKVLEKLIPSPEIFAGYSLGELSIYHFSGIIEAEDLLKLAAVRGRLMSGAVEKKQTMTAITGLTKDKTESICKHHDAYIAIVNSYEHFVIGLTAGKSESFADECRKAGAAKTVQLPVSVASHTPYMRKAALDFGEELKRVNFKESAAGIIAGTSGEKLFSPEDMRQALAKQIDSVINWYSCMEAAAAYGCRVFLETGPGNSLSKMLTELFPDMEARSVSDFHDIYAVKTWVASAIGRQY